MIELVPDPVKIGVYARCSTLLGQDPENQLIPIREFARARRYSIYQEFVDHGVSGVKERRPELDALVRAARIGKFKIIVVAAIDRIGRNTRHLLNLLHEMNEIGVSFISLRESIDFSTPTGQLMFSIISSVSTLERSLISERIKTSLAAKKLLAQTTKSGWRCGRRSVISPALVHQICCLRAEGYSVRKIEARIEGKAGHSTIAKIVRAHCPQTHSKISQTEHLNPITYEVSL